MNFPNTDFLVSINFLNRFSEEIDPPATKPS